MRVKEKIIQEYINNVNDIEKLCKKALKDRGFSRTEAQIDLTLKTILDGLVESPHFAVMACDEMLRRLEETPQLSFDEFTQQ